jgi:hypothetical protein
MQRAIAGIQIVHNGNRVIQNARRAHKCDKNDTKGSRAIQDTS